ncbi:MAG: class I SAM-dependent methyltransferase [Rhabdochlamydiaceae bacterium]|nr:class I SAM-dependent methyltransferase [Rhabdochlamydiaceae bacterium]
MIKKIQETECLSTYDSSHLDQLVLVEEVHFWFKHRRDYICRVFDQFVDKNARILEIGGGTGYIASQLSALGFHVELSDMHANGLRYAQKRGIAKVYQLDLFDSPFEADFDVICLFDVLEHLHDPTRALQCIKKMLKPRGLIILTVPTHGWLWSRDDRIAGHQKRYTKEILRQEFNSAGVNPLYMRYFFSAILPFLLMRRWLKRDDGTPLKTNEETSWHLPRWMNRFFDVWMFMERVLPKWAGGSLIAIAQNTPSDDK